MIVYDKINFVWKVAEQIVGRTGVYMINTCPESLLKLTDVLDALQNGTTATSIGLLKANREDLQTKVIQDHLIRTPKLVLRDMSPPGLDDPLWKECMCHTVLRILIRQGGTELRRFAEELQRDQPANENVIDLRDRVLDSACHEY